ncbi:dirigent protein 4-like [Tripterygium wilfordii]|uniref:dirigent protein 4-like n=1 Tax=Tripterygium wilfordii TaxID=458696 RepID=UPI0018F81E07|nr:dirigent protein 4-like [Tripterygium wilfordii]
MKGRVIILALLALMCCINTGLAHKKSYYTKSRPYVHKQKQVTNLHFYYHETSNVENATTVIVAKPAANDPSPSQFGTITAMDDPLTIGPDPSSEVIGKAQGMYVFAGQDRTMLVMYADFGFLKGKFNGSSISVMSRNSVLDRERDLAVVGGTGKFRMAKGLAMLKTYSGLKPHVGTHVEYKIKLVHYN